MAFGVWCVVVVVSLRDVVAEDLDLFVCGGVSSVACSVVVDVERGRTVPGWLPRRLGGGIGDTRKGGKDVNLVYSGR